MTTNTHNEKHVRDTIRWFVDQGEAVANPSTYFPAAHAIVFNLSINTNVTLEKRIVNKRRRYRVYNESGEQSAWFLGNQKPELYVETMALIDKAPEWN